MKSNWMQRLPCREALTSFVISGQITKLYEKFLSPENVIILNVISAVTDLQANESVLFAHKVTFCSCLPTIPPFSSQKKRDTRLR